MRALLGKGADVNARRRNDGVTALMMAAQEGHRDMVQTLLDNRAEVDSKANSGATALILASMAGQQHVVQALLAKTADVNARDATGMTALGAATAVGKAATRALLVQAGGQL